LEQKGTKTRPRKLYEVPNMDVTPKNKGSFLRPLKALSFLFREPVTLPMEPRPAAENYRGFHVNDWEKCIGCGTCAEICDNEAISMVHIPDLPEDHKNGIKPRRPAIDYGRCCWCALCVDICPTGSIALSREYIHISREMNTFFILPDEKGMHGLGYPIGWGKNEDSDLLDLKRQPMGEVEPEARSDNFDEIVDGFDAHTALIEASRCIQCGMCHEACPTNMHAPQYIRAIWEGNVEKAVEEIYRTNPFPQVCGRVCTHRCETACSIGRRGEPVAIRWLKRYAIDAVSPAKVKKIALADKAKKKSGKKVAIVGSGPAGLTTAFDLAKLGHAVTVYESKEKPGGMMRYGIPEYRLPYDKLDADIAVIEAAGVAIECGKAIGRDIGFDALRSDNDAVVVATGLGQGRSTRIPGSDQPGVFSAVDLLARVTAGESFDLKESAAVIGGGNVAFDIARSLARLQKKTFGKVDVTLVALEARDRMLADEEEVIEGGEEGVKVFTGRGPKQIVVENGAIKGLETVLCLSIFDEEGRFHPKYDEADVILHPAAMVVEAIGQATDVSYLGKDVTEALEWERGRIKIGRDGSTAVPWLFAAGDMVEGPDVIHAVAAGHRTASAIDTFLGGGSSKLEAAE